MDSDSDRGILALGEDIVCRQESKAVGTDIIHGGRIFRIRIFELDGAGIVQIHTGVFTAVIDPGSGINDDFEGGQENDNKKPMRARSETNERMENGKE